MTSSAKSNDAFASVLLFHVILFCLPISLFTYSVVFVDHYSRQQYLEHIIVFSLWFFLMFFIPSIIAGIMHTKNRGAWLWYFIAVFPAFLITGYYAGKAPAILWEVAPRSIFSHFLLLIIALCWRSDDH